MLGWVLIEILSGIPLVQAVDPVRPRAFFGFWGCLGVWGNVGRGRRFFGRVCLRGMGVV